MNEAERFGAGMHVDDRLPFIEANVKIGSFTVLGRQPITTLANRRKVHLAGQGRIGSGSVIGCLCVIYAGVFIGRDVCVGDGAVIREEVHVGDRSVIGTKADIQYGVTIGNDVRVMNYCHITGGTTIGDGTFIGPGVFTANDPHIAHFDLSDYQDRGQVGPVIGRFVFIGLGAILLPGVKIGDRSVIAAGAVVTSDVPEGSLVIAAGVKGEVRPMVSALRVAHQLSLFNHAS